jgi:ComF family protein
MYGIINKTNVQNVKNTMLDTLLSLIAPHLCCSCGVEGAILCDHCRYDIVNESYSACLECGTVVGSRGVCAACAVPYSRAWCVGERTDGLQRLIGMYKFQSVIAAGAVIGDLVLDVLPELPSETVVIPVPTVRSHIRERGFDHALVMAKHVSKKRRLRLATVLRRRTTTKQRDATRAQRLRQARDAFVVRGTVRPVPHLLIDDVVTTGATVRFASQALLDAGASEVWVVAVARQPLD